MSTVTIDGITYLSGTRIEVEELRAMNAAGYTNDEIQKEMEKRKYLLTTKQIEDVIWVT